MLSVIVVANPAFGLQYYNKRCYVMLQRAGWEKPRRATGWRRARCCNWQSIPTNRWRACRG